jgi:hypothetical protein
VDVSGKPIATEFRHSGFRGVAPRVDDPPTFESQATYLERHDLLLDGERERIPPAGWQPEALAVLVDDEPDVRAQFPNAFANAVFDDLERPPR